MSNRTELRTRLRQELGDTGTLTVWSDTLLDSLLVEAGDWYSRLWPRQTEAYRDVASGQRAFDRHVHRANVEIEAELPVLGRAVEHRSVMHVSGAIEQDGQRRELSDGLGDGGIVENVERLRSDAGGVGVALERLGVDVGGVNRRAFPRHGQRGRVADALAREAKELKR